MDLFKDKKIDLSKLNIKGSVSGRFDHPMFAKENGPLNIEFKETGDADSMRMLMEWSKEVNAIQDKVDWMAVGMLEMFLGHTDKKGNTLEEVIPNEETGEITVKYSKPDGSMYSMDVRPDYNFGASEEEPPIATHVTMTTTFSYDEEPDETGN